MKETKKNVIGLFLRYLLLVLAAFPELWIFYFIFTPLTVYPAYFLLSLLYPVDLSGITLTTGSFSIKLVEACIAGSAYYLLLILNLSTSMKLRTRIFAILFSFLAFLIINILRIFFFSLLFISSFSMFNIFHLIFWYFVSSIMVFLIWLGEIKIFKIKNIPVYDDLVFLYRNIKKL